MIELRTMSYELRTKNYEFSLQSPVDGLRTTGKKTQKEYSMYLARNMYQDPKAPAKSETRITSQDGLGTPKAAQQISRCPKHEAKI